MQCPSCGSRDVIRETRDETIRYKGEAVVVRGLAGDLCRDCGEVVFDVESYDRYRATSDALIVSINKRNAPDLRRIRRRLGLTQAEAGRLFGGGVTAFSRYERGETQPPVALAKLFRLLDNHPELLEEVRGRG